MSLKSSSPKPAFSLEDGAIRYIRVAKKSVITRLGLTAFLLVGNCHLTYAQSPVTADSGANLSFLPGGFASGNGCCSVVTADFNGDGKADIATVRGTAVVTITLGVGNGDFRPKDLPFDLGPGVVFQGLVAAADFNGDHIPDLLALTQVASPPVSGGVVLLGVGDGTFRAPIFLGPVT